MFPAVPINQLKFKNMKKDKRNDFIDNINDLSLSISLYGEKIFKSEKEETQVINLLEQIFNILSK